MSVFNIVLLTSIIKQHFETKIKTLRHIVNMMELLKKNCLCLFAVNPRHETEVAALIFFSFHIIFLFDRQKIYT